MENHIDIKLITKETNRNHLISDSNYHTTKLFSRTFFIHRNEKTHKYSRINQSI